MKRKVCGVDEVGRGAAVGRIFAAACILYEHKKIPDLNDSKQLSPKKRLALSSLIKEGALDWHIAAADLQDINKLNVHYASLLAMKRAIEGLSCGQPMLVLADGRYSLEVAFECKNIVGGDKKVPAISAASILAKVARDREMEDLDLEYPQFGWKKNKGYLTKEHLDALMKYGPSPYHRQNYKPVKEAKRKRSGKLRENSQ